MAAAKKLHRSELSTPSDKRTTLKTQSAPSSLFCRGFTMLPSFRWGEGNSWIDNVGQNMKAAKTKSTKGCIITPNWKSFPFYCVQQNVGWNPLYLACDFGNKGALEAIASGCEIGRWCQNRMSYKMRRTIPGKSRADLRLQFVDLRAIWKGLLLRLDRGEFDDLIGFRLPFRNLFIVAVDSFLIKQMNVIDDRGP